jgi:hypothetical protein
MAARQAGPVFPPGRLLRIDANAGVREAADGRVKQRVTKAEAVAENPADT